MRVLVYEPKFVGHFLGFATWSVNAYAKLGYESILCVPKQAEHTEQANVKLARVDPSVDVQYVIDTPLQFDKWSNARAEANSLVQDLARVKPDFLMVPSGDFLMCGLLRNGALRRAIGRLNGADFILHACPQAYPPLGPRDRLWKYLDRLCIDMSGSIRVHTVDPYATLDESGAMSNFGKQVFPMPHPFDSLEVRDRLETRDRLGLPHDRRIIASLGDLGVRKGTDLLLRSFFELNPPGISLFLGGVLSKEVRGIVNEHKEWIDDGRIFLRDEFVSDDVFTDAFFAADALWAGYPRQIGIASILLFAAEARRPVLAANNGSVGWMTEEYGLGITFDPFSPNGAIDALRQYADQPSLEVDDAGAERLMAIHTLENYEREITRQARSISPPREAVAH